MGYDKWQDWEQYAKDCIALLRPTNKQVYYKHCLRILAPNVEFLEFECNPDRYIVKVDDEQGNVQMSLFD